MAETVEMETPLAAGALPCATPCEQAAEEGLLAQLPAQAFGIESDDGASSSGAAEDPRPLRSLGRWRLRPRALAAAALGAALLLGCAAAGAVRWRWQGMEEGEVDESVELGAIDSMTSVLGTLADAVHQTADLTDKVQESFNTAQNVSASLQHTTGKFQHLGSTLMGQLRAGPEARKKLIAKFKSLNATQKAKIKARLFKRFNITSLKQLRPMLHLHDGNPCQNDEEEYESLCYKKCSILTDHNFPFRISAWECCQHPGPCGVAYKMDFSLCGGFGVAGDEVGGGCPHTKGACLSNEELYGNICYKKCAMLTYGVLSHRTGPMTCCKEKTSIDFLAFLDFENCDTKNEYGIGGGEGDNDTRTPSQPHPPLMSLAES